VSDDYLLSAQEFATKAAAEAHHDLDTAQVYAMVAIANALTSLAWTGDLKDRSS
jgi:hypothetical protein